MSNTHISKLNDHMKAVPLLLLAMDEVELNDKPIPTKWSKKEILGHLVDSAVYNLERFTKVRFCVPPFEIIPYPQDALVEANQYRSQEIEDILFIWEALNRQILSVWRTYTADELKIPVVDQKYGNKGTLLWWIKDYLSHLEHHLVQILGNQYNNKKLWLSSSGEALAILASSDKPFVKLLEHGDMSVEYYSPVFEDLQTPHDQDEIYIIDKGEGVFLNGEVRHIFEAGDVIFVPAGIEHRFEEFSEDFGTWVIFYGSRLGEPNYLQSN